MTKVATSARALRTLAREHLGFESLRPGQEQALRAVLRGRDTLSIMPTGSGKSAIYQLAGIAAHHTAIVVSPLIALQRDQVGSILEGSDATAAELNSTMSDHERREVFERFTRGKIAFLFAAPEQFANEETLEDLAAAKPTMLVIDEAHCISEWGHDFRPDYLKLGKVIEQFGHPVVVALTATAAPHVRDEIVERLGMVDPAIIVEGFDRPNIYLAVETFTDEDDKRTALLDRIAASKRPGIVYAATRKDTEELADALNERGIAAGAYHAGLSDTKREQMHDEFMQNEVEVIVATIAFGMGIDKPDVRFVYHHDISESLDAYYQEIGRAGRDGERADATLFYLPGDLDLRRFQSGAGTLDVDEVEPVLRSLKRVSGPVEVTRLQDNLDLPESKLTRVLTRLDDVGVIDMRSDGQVEVRDKRVNIREAAEAAVSEQEHHRSFVHSRLEMMRRYAGLTDCRRQFLLGYFGEVLPDPCGFCDNCEAGLSQEHASDSPYALNSRVLHQTLGEGTVTHAGEDTITVLFDDSGYKELSLAIIEEENLLEPVE